MKDDLQVRVNSPEKLIWEGKAGAVSSVNTQGPFDILPKHANFITFVEKQPIRVHSGGKIQDYTFDHAIIYIHDDQVSIYAGQQTPTDV